MKSVALFTFLATAVMVGGCVQDGLPDPGPESSAVSASESRSRATAVEKATGISDIAQSTSWDAKTAVFTSGTAAVTVPQQSDGVVTVTGTDGYIVGIGLPTTGANSSAWVSTAGTVVYGNLTTHVEAAVQPTRDGARVLVALKSSSAPTEYRFPISLPTGATLSQQDDGKVSVDVPVKSPTGDGDTMFSIGGFDAAWAKDANGNAVPTSYSLDGTTLVQTITPNAQTAFPVVADPHYTWGWISGTVYFNKKETAHAAANAGFIAVLFAAAPPPFDAYGILNAANISRVAWNATSDHKCVKIKVPTFLAYEYSGGYCK